MHAFKFGAEAVPTVYHTQIDIERASLFGQKCCCRQALSRRVAASRPLARIPELILGAPERPPAGPSRPRVVHALGARNRSCIRERHALAVDLGAGVLVGVARPETKHPAHFAHDAVPVSAPVARRRVARAYAAASAAHARVLRTTVIPCREVILDEPTPVRAAPRAPGVRVIGTRLHVAVRVRLARAMEGLGGKRRREVWRGVCRLDGVCEREALSVDVHAVIRHVRHARRRVVYRRWHRGDVLHPPTARAERDRHRPAGVHGLSDTGMRGGCWQRWLCVRRVGAWYYTMLLQRRNRGHWSRAHRRGIRARSIAQRAEVGYGVGRQDFVGSSSVQSGVVGHRRCASVRIVAVARRRWRGI